ncbi:hypothetical protein RFI_06324 [Reticulomyxa filosa]|uniref:Sulfotransferase domain-containing protein n=1 Tax=Reticulomyxa filosa TaxID=46433 RepID=X6NY42_RETFI|nr:hypothetical protein RFI_06324 [Reticulomyxa filosa]|eukprot:ETO30798.1 hypothetical protein RFI_06324 [Reticulomyxa filosa]
MKYQPKYYLCLLIWILFIVSYQLLSSKLQKFEIQSSVTLALPAWLTSEILVFEYPGQWNTSRNGSTLVQLLLFSRIPKCGTTMLSESINDLGQLHVEYILPHFNSVHYPNAHPKERYDQGCDNAAQFKQFVKDALDRIEESLSANKKVEKTLHMLTFHKPIHSLNETMRLIHELHANHKLQFQSKLVYITMVRNPVKRLISSYNAGSIGGSNTYRITNSHLIKETLAITHNLTIEQCIQMQYDTIFHQNKENPCFLSRNYLTKWFCDESQCKKHFDLINSNNDLILEGAWKNIDRLYTFVGVLEYWDASLLWLWYKFGETFLFDKEERKNNRKYHTWIDFDKHDIEKVSRYVLGSVGTQTLESSDKSTYPALNMKYRAMLEEMNALDMKLYNGIVEKFKTYIEPQMQPYIQKYYNKFKQ